MAKKALYKYSSFPFLSAQLTLSQRYAVSFTRRHVTGRKSRLEKNPALTVKLRVTPSEFRKIKPERWDSNVVRSLTISKSFQHSQWHMRRRTEQP